MEKALKIIFLTKPILYLLKYKDLRCIKHTYTTTITILAGISIGRLLPI